MDKITPDSDLALDTRMLLRLTRNRMKTWLVLAPGVFIVCVALQGLVQSQKYSATATMSMESSEPGPSSSPLAILTGASSDSKVIGLLESRRLALMVAKRVPIQRAYGLPNELAAAGMLTKGIKAEVNSSTGLLEVTITLPGPPLLAPGTGVRKKQICDLTAACANAYSKALGDYYSQYDNTRDSVIQRSAKHELALARRDYDTASNNVLDFLNSLKTYDPRTSPDTSTAANLAQFYQEAASTDASLQAALAAQSDKASGIHRQLTDINHLPLEDPFLQAERERLSQAQLQYHELTQVEMLANQNPLVVRAAARLAAAQAALDRQETAYRQYYTTDSVTMSANIASLRAKLTAITNAIRASAKRLPAQRDLAYQMDQLKGEQQLQFGRLKETLTRYVDVKLSTVSGRSRVTVVDTALAPQSGAPGLIRIFVLSVFACIVVCMFQLGRDYLREFEATSAATAPPKTTGA